MKTLIAFLNAFIPAATPILARVPELVGLIRSAFQKVGGTDADIDAILAANQKDIDRLGDPDSFRHKPDSAPPVDVHPHPASKYDVVFTSTPNNSDYKAGDRVYRSPDSSRWRVEDPNAPMLGINWVDVTVLDHVVT